MGNDLVQFGANCLGDAVTEAREKRCTRWSREKSHITLKAKEQVERPANQDLGNMKNTAPCSQKCGLSSATGMQTQHDLVCK